MSKYDFSIDLSDTSSTGIILKMIKPGSTVLEFGCATGRMTRYMKQMLNCRVYIVEYEQSAFDEAINYAEDGICEDLLTLSWKEKFKDVDFDAIIFADVLEHLKDPAKALRGASQVLKQDGCIYVSVPNVTHNDVLIKAFQNHFDYTKVGLLDDTHVHFWGLENLKPFVNECGLSLLDFKATYCETGFTEQYDDCAARLSQRLLNRFNERIAGNVYQFIMALGKQGNEIDNVEGKLRKPYIKSHVYYDRGEGFSEYDVTEIFSEMTDSGRYSTHFVLENVAGIKRLRFDPIEQQECILLYVSIRQAGRELEIGFNDYVDAETGKLLLSTDSMICADISPDAGKVIIDAELIISSDEFEQQLKKLCVSKTLEIKKALDDNIDLKKEIANAQREKIFLTNELNNKNVENYSLQVREREYLFEIRQLQEDLNAYITLAEKKEALLLELQQNGGFFKKVRKKIHAVLRKIKHKVFRSGN